MIRRFADPEAFLAGDGRRVLSHGVVFGGAWRTGDSAKGSWRCVWLEATGELVVVKQRWVEGLHVLGAVHVLATGLYDVDEVRELLAGWEARCGPLWSLDWLRERCAARVSAGTLGA